MAPHDTAGVGNLCPNASDGCKSLCLGMYSGQAAMVSDLENGTNAVRESRIAKSQYFMNERQAFMAEMTDHVRAMIRKADRENKELAVRPNGSTDIAFERIPTDNGQPLPIRFPEIQFVDYTKSVRRVPDANRPANYHLTFSLSETNKAQAEQVLAAGFNVAVVFGAGQPATFMGHRVIRWNGARFTTLGSATRYRRAGSEGQKAKTDTSGFVVRDYGAGC